MEINSQFDVIIVGGGMVGAAQAVALCRQQKRVLLIENNLPQTSWLEASPLRVSAVNLFSEKLLQEFGLWQHLSSHSRCVFNHLATWERTKSEKEGKGQKSETVMFSAEDIGASHLGHLIRNEALQLAAYEEFKQLDNPPTILSNIKLEGVSQTEDDVTITVCQNEQSVAYQAKLLIGADGANSAVRRLSKIGTSGWDYQQQCLSITIKTHFDQQDITWQEFQPSGPKAFLPLADGFASLIWYDSAKKIKALKQLDDARLKTEVFNTFPSLAGDFDVIQMASFPLTRRQANQYVSNRVVLIGDAAHTINPLAGQGVNLGYKDLAKLSELLVDTDLTDLNSVSTQLTKYQRIRKLESQVMSAAMDSFYTLFSNDKTPLKLLRKTMLSVANKLPLAKKEVLKKAVGY